ncbi:MAG: UDP-N-acetylmuramoyl-tripeptide--D-alanyl-D-alanine ligase [bacterium]
MNVSSHSLLPLALFLLFLGGYVPAAWRITIRFLHYFQQEEYDNRRFLRWWMRSRSFEKRATLLALVLGLALLVHPRLTLPLPPPEDSRLLIAAGIMAALLALAGLSNKSRNVKKALVMTARAKRIFTVCLLLQTAAFPGETVCFWISSIFTDVMPGWIFSLTLLSFAAALFAIPLFLVAANWILIPVESRIQQRYLNEAREILARVKPHIIGITGSYGKTSTKHILDHILAMHAPSLATPGSVNTLMGITRIIRERLKPEHAFFIVEMGAYGIGSIQKLCGLTPPKTAIVTAVGVAHMERFKTIETVARAKSELPRALPPDGFAILNGDNPHVRAMASGIQAKAYFYGRNAEAGPLDCRLVQDESTATGSHCVLEYNEKTYTFDLPLHGAPQALNAAGAFLAGILMGVPPLTAVAALQTVPPISHRLVVQRGTDGITTIDDAYNSNPIGFASALQVLQSLPGGRKFLVTPGMVELGSESESAHRQLAPLAALACDRIALVAPGRIPSFVSGLLEKGFPRDNLCEFNTLGDARNWLQTELRPGDVVLFENDLPDLYEEPSAFTLFGGETDNTFSRTQN